MNEEDLRRVAKRVLEEPLYTKFFQELEKQALDLAIAAPLTDHDKRAAYISEARAIRALQAKIRQTAFDTSAVKGVTA